MQTTSLDILEKTELPTNQARAILRVMELEMAAQEDVLATKGDLKDAFHALELAIQSMRTELKGDIAGLRGDLSSKIEAVRGELRTEIKASEGKTARWVLTCTLGQAAMLGSALYFALTHR